MKIKTNYFIIPLIVVLVGLSGSLITLSGKEWYQSINIPSWTPSGATIGFIWTIIFILSAIAALIAWNKKESVKKRELIAVVFIANAILNILWSALFFVRHFIGLAALEAGLLGASVFLLIYLIKPISKTAAFLLLPYGLWTFFATYLTYIVGTLNK
jgi:tryptophan-rich sensory protein